jgi:N-acetylmuramoyl-L-alanine amidase
LAIFDFLDRNYDNLEMMITRATDVFVSLKDRTDAANAWGADFFLSIHCNASPNGNASGFSSYSYVNANDQTRAAQNVIHNEIVKMIPDMKDLGQLKGDFHVVRQSKMLALLTENGFISNAQDAQKLRSQDFIRRVAEGHARGLASFLGLKPKAVDTLDYLGHWAEKDIQLMRDKGYMSRFEDGTFRPDSPLTRAQFATVMTKILNDLERKK